MLSKEVRKELIALSEQEKLALISTIVLNDLKDEGLSDKYLLELIASARI